MTVAADKSFTIGTFQKVYRSSRARKYLSRMETEQIRQAVEAKNLPLLKTLYDVLLQEKLKDEEIVREFVMTKNRIIDEFTVKAKHVHFEYVRKPVAKRHEVQRQKESDAADDILNNL